MATKILKYTLEDFENITFGGFEYTIPDTVLETISQLAVHVGSPDYVKTPVFPKRENPMKTTASQDNSSSNNKDINRKRKGNKNMEVVDDGDWNALRNFQTTTIETKSGVEADFDAIRSLINKLTDKNYNDMKSKIFEIVNKIYSEKSESQLEIISANIFDIASSNRYYSKIYA